MQLRSHKELQSESAEGEMRWIIAVISKKSQVESFLSDSCNERKKRYGLIWCWVSNVFWHLFYTYDLYIRPKRFLWPPARFLHMLCVSPKP